MLDKHQQKLTEIYRQQHNLAVDGFPRDFGPDRAEYVQPPRREYWLGPVKDSPMDMIDDKPESSFVNSDQVTFHAGCTLHDVIKHAANHVRDENMVPFFHMVLAHLHTLSYVPGALVYIERFIPWESIAKFLNTVGPSGVSYGTVESSTFPKSTSAIKRQLPEDFPMRGLMLMSYYYPADFSIKRPLWMKMNDYSNFQAIKYRVSRDACGPEFNWFRYVNLTSHVHC